VTTRLDLRLPADKDLLRDKLEQDIKDYLKKGGVVKVCKRGASVYDPEIKTSWGEMSVKRAEIIRIKHKGK